ncbi:MAG TPA: sugar phosphate isomerase/epimerase family protein [Verrucomicrobiota bacterium]|nr:sugar phosphate isomerase/epimerase family protein [Verrucomicrobiota bacterium]HNT13964.1 sugar phosphate isomerase/epimerase family protein [Verrucomicrobiota bacterium]
MRVNSLRQRLAVCSWSLQPTSPEDLISKLQQTGVSRVQLALDPLRDDPAAWSQTPARLQAAGVGIASGMFGCVGEDYTSLETIRRTGGIAPDATWDQNWKNIQATAALARQLGLKLVTFHAGFLPHDPTDPDFTKLKQRLLQTADCFQAQGVALGLETGQETAAVLAEFLRHLNQPNVGVNFDPANMILYDKGDPLAALRQLAPWLRQVHVKDARRTQVPGTWGEEVAAGTGEVDWRQFFAVLAELGFQGDLCIEREAGQQRVADIRTARELVERL